MTIRPPSGIPLPELVLVANRVLAEEAEALRTAFGGLLERAAARLPVGAGW